MSYLYLIDISAPFSLYLFMFFFLIQLFIYFSNELFTHLHLDWFLFALSPKGDWGWLKQRDSCNSITFTNKG